MKLAIIYCMIFLQIHEKHTVILDKFLLDTKWSYSVYDAYAQHVYIAAFSNIPLLSR